MLRVSRTGGTDCSGTPRRLDSLSSLPRKVGLVPSGAATPSRHTWWRVTPYASGRMKVWPFPSWDTCKMGSVALLLCFPCSPESWALCSKEPVEMGRARALHLSLMFIQDQGWRSWQGLVACSCVSQTHRKYLSKWAHGSCNKTISLSQFFGWQKWLYHTKTVLNSLQH